MFRFIKRLFGKDDSLEEVMSIIKKTDSKWFTIGEDIAEDCFNNGLIKGKPVYLNQTIKQIHDHYNFNANVIENGFLSKMEQYIDSGVVINLSVQGVESMFIHKDYAQEVIKLIKK